MNSALITTTTASAKKLCLHCGNTVPPNLTGHFCCRGCESVHALLKTRGLDTYYELKKDSTRVTPPVQTQSSEDLGYLDDPVFIQKYSHADGLEMRFYLEGVHCTACVWLTEKLPDWAPGVEWLHLNLSNSIATVRIKPGGSFTQAAHELIRLGYFPHPIRENESDEIRKKENRHLLIQLGVAAAMSGNIMLLAFALYAGADGRLAELFRWTSLVLFLPVFLYSAVPFYRSAWGSIRVREISIDVPIVFGIWIGTITSIVNLVTGASHLYFDSIAGLVFLLLSTRYLLRKVHQKSISASQVVHFLAPSRVRKKNSNGEFTQESTDSLHPGDIIQVLGNECFPVDGIIVSGQSLINSALLTGESLPIQVKPGTHVHTGTWNLGSPLEIQVLASGTETRLGKIVSAMEDSLTRHAPIVTFLDQVGQSFVIAVILLTFVGFFLGLQNNWDDAIQRALAVAIVVCPCTFALATPLAMSLAIERCAKNGILVNGADIIERLSQIKNVFFDKTGTLTEVKNEQGDPLRPDSKQTLDQIRQLGLDIFLLSGDSPERVHSVATALNIPKEQVTARATPEEKARIVQSTPMSLMVGDGANDTIALASAFVGIAVKGGMEMSMKAAGAYSTQPGVKSVYSLIVVARETMRVIHRNLAFAIFYNVIGISVALLGYLNPLFAAVLMPVSALTVFLSTLAGTSRLRRAFVPESKK